MDAARPEIDPGGAEDRHYRLGVRERVTCVGFGCLSGSPDEHSIAEQQKSS